MFLIDIGANLTHESFRHDFDKVIARAAAQGVTQLVVTGASLPGSKEALALARARPGRLYATAGVHPHHATDYDDAVEAGLRALAAAPEVRAMGETGLDYHRHFSPREAQLVAFERQLQLACELELPVFLHQRAAHADFLALLRCYRERLPAAVVHCFTDQRQALLDYLDLDCHIGITGWLCDERRGAHLAELVRLIPAERLMIETDAPYLLPRTIRPPPPQRRNEPMYLLHICQALAAVRGESVETLAASTTNVAQRFFRLDQPSATEARAS